MHLPPFSTSQPGGRAFLPRNSSAIILDIIRQNPRISRKELAHISGFSPALVTKICAELLRQDLIREVGIGHSSGGRRPIYIEFNHEAFSVVCFHTSSRGSSMAVCDCCGNVRTYRFCSETAPVLTPQALAEAAARCREEGVDWKGIGLAVEDTLYTEELASEFYRYFEDAGYPVLVQRSSFAALWGLNKYIYHERYQDCCYLCLGEEVYGAVLSGGRPLTGSSRQLGCTWKQLPMVQELERLLRSCEKDGYEAVCDQILSLCRILRLLFDADLVVLDLLDPALPAGLAPHLRERILGEQGNLDLMPFRSLFHRGMADMLSNHIGWSSREDLR